MHSDRYVHPEFGLLSPTPRLRRELRMAFFSVLFGIAIGAAAVIALSGNKPADDARVSELSSASVITEQPTEAVLGNEVKGHTSESDGTKAQVNSENHKPSATTTCEGTNPFCGTPPPLASKPRGMRRPAETDASGIGRAPIGRRDTSAEMTSVAPAVPSEQSTAARSEEAPADPGAFKRLDRKPHKSARSRPRERAANYRDHRGASRVGRAYERPGGELDRAYALDRSYGPSGFWNWSR
jgi:hypothetical protein